MSKKFNNHDLTLGKLVTKEASVNTPSVSIHFCLQTTHPITMKVTLCLAAVALLAVAVNAQIGPKKW